jgi:glycosyltransferase involved in cell wall biosynthesis
MQEPEKLIMEYAPEVSFIIPLYNEEEIFSELVSRLDAVIKTLGFTVEIILVDDGSRDKTSQLMYAKAITDTKYHCVFLSRNHGHQLALSAGFAQARGSKAIMVLDGDLQDPPELVTEFYEKIKEGYDVVYAIRKKREEGPFKKFAYWLYYRLLKSIANFDIPLDSGDFSMISPKVLHYLNSMPEKSRYIRGMRSWVGFKQIGIDYERSARFAGETKYSLKKLFELAYNGIFNFSDFPIKVVTRLGLTTVFISLAYSVYILIKKLLGGEIPQGFTTLVIAIILFSGVQLICLGVIGEYVLRIYKQVQGRPLFVIRSIVRDGKIL